MFALLTAQHRRHDEQLRALRQRHDGIAHLLNGLLFNRLAAFRAIRATNAGKEQTQIIIDFRNGAHRRSRVAPRRLLIDGDGRRQALDVVHVRLIHLAQELARVRRQRFHIAPLPFRINGIERQRRLAGATQAGDNDKLITRQRKVNILKIMLSGSFDNEFFLHRNLHSIG